MSEHKDDWRTAAFIGLGLAGLGIGGALAAASASMGDDAVPIWLMAVVLVIVLARSPVAKALAARIGQDPAESTGEVSAEVYGELDELRARVLELEERQDFAERLLASRDEVTEQR